MELLSSEFVKIDRYTIEVERKLLGFSVSSEVFRTHAVGNLRAGVIRNWSSKGASTTVAGLCSRKAGMRTGSRLGFRMLRRKSW